MKVDSASVSIPLADPSSQVEINSDSEKSQKFAQKLDDALKDKNEEELRKACQQLESVFLNQILQSMRATIPKSDFLGQSFATDTFESMLDEEYAKEISKTGSTGLAEIIFRQLSQKLSTD